jgi:hypothetical protein
MKKAILPDNCPLEDEKPKSSKPYFKPIRRIYRSKGRGKRSVY